MINRQLLRQLIFQYGRCFLAGFLIYVSINLIFGNALSNLGNTTVEVYYAQF